MLPVLEYVPSVLCSVGIALLSTNRRPSKRRCLIMVTEEINTNNIRKARLLHQIIGFPSRYIR